MLEISPKVKIESEQAREKWEIEWEQALREARKEGKVVIYSTGGGEVRALGLAFQKKHGIAVELIVGRGAELTSRLAAERKAGLYLVDLYMGGSGTAMVDWKGMVGLPRPLLTGILPGKGRLF